MALLGGATARDLTIEAFTATPLGTDTVLVTFISVADAPGIPERRAWRMSIWIRRDDRWRLRFHQGTPIDGP